MDIEILLVSNVGQYTRNNDLQIFEKKTFCPKKQTFDIIRLLWPYFISLVQHSNRNNVDIVVIEPRVWFLVITAA